jgi:hypothetical protein
VLTIPGSWLQKHSLSLDDFEELIYTNFVIAEKLAQHMFADKIEPFFLNTSWIMPVWSCMRLSWMMKIGNGTLLCDSGRRDEFP